MDKLQDLFQNEERYQGRGGIESRFETYQGSPGDDTGSSWQEIPSDDVLEEAYSLAHGCASLCDI